MVTSCRAYLEAQGNGCHKLQGLDYVSCSSKTSQSLRQDFIFLKQERGGGGVCCW